MKNRLSEGVLNHCPVCKKYVMVVEEKMMVAVESPYLNIYFHIDCYNQVKDTLKEFMEKNLDEYLKTTPN
jgi:hypothetical protein